VWYFVSNKHYSIEQKRGKKIVIFLVLGKPHATHFPKSLPLSHFPQTMPNFPFIRPFDRLRRHILHQHLFLIQLMGIA
jgi:hypothetical protein